MTPLQGNEQQAQSDLEQTSWTLGACMVQTQVQSKYLMTSKDGKVSIGKTGVHLRYNTNSKYRELSTSQKKELSEWCEKDSEKKKKPRNEKRKAKSREISAAVTKALTDMMKSKQDLDPTNNIVSGLLKAAMTGTDAKKENGEVSAVNNASSEAKRPLITLKSILRHARNGFT